MSTGKRPDHCKGCVSYHMARGEEKALKPRAAWCCNKGAPAAQSVGWCKTHNKKTESQTAQYLLETKKGLIVDERV